MSRFFASVCLLLPLISLLSSPVALTQLASGQERSPRAETRQRRVGHLKPNPQAETDGFPYVLRDVWDKREYLVRPGKGLELDNYLDRYVALHGSTTTGEADGADQFQVEKVIDLDTKKKRPKGKARVSYAVQQAAFQESSPATTLPSEALEPSASVAPLEMGEVIEIPTPDLMTDGPLDTTFLDPQPDALMAGPCRSCGLPHLNLGAGLLSLVPSGAANCCASRESVWVRAEWLLWWTDGLRLPPLVTTSPAGTPRAQAGVLGETGTRVLNPVAVNNDAHSGFRIRAGAWFGGLGFGGDYYGLNSQTSNYTGTSAGDPILARPFYDILNARQTAELVAFPGVVQGTVSVGARTKFDSAGLHLRMNLCCADWTANACGHDGYRLDGILGYRFARLDDDLIIREDLVSQDPANPGSFRIRDQFRTENEFHGAEVGIQYQRQRGRWMVELLSKLAFGNNHQVVTIDGDTVVTTGAINMAFPGGILAQRTNSGRFARDEFAVLPEIGVTLGYQMTPRLKLTVGYTLVYLSNVVRAGDQIDLDVNPNLFPPEAVPFAGPLRPEFAFRETDFWAQGLSVGGDFRW